MDKPQSIVDMFMNDLDVEVHIQNVTYFILGKLIFLVYYLGSFSFLITKMYRHFGLLKLHLQMVFKFYHACRTLNDADDFFLQQLFNISYNTSGKNTDEQYFDILDQNFDIWDPKLDIRNQI